MIYSITIDIYSENSVAVRGSDTSKFKDTLKEFGGKWNPNLKGGPGWIFSSSVHTKLTKFLDVINIPKSTKNVDESKSISAEQEMV